VNKRTLQGLIATWVPKALGHTAFFLNSDAMPWGFQQQDFEKFC
jgi:hypothetical protein